MRSKNRKSTGRRAPDLRLASPDIEAYAAKSSRPENALLRALKKETYRSARWPKMQVGHLEGAFLTLLTRAIRARRVLEIGTFTGYSALSFAEGLPASGRVVTLDVDPVNTKMAKRFWARSPHGRKIRLILGDARETLRTLDGFFDLVFIDADKENYEAYWNAVVPRVRPGGVVLADNVLWSGEALRPTDAAGRAIARFNRRVARDRRVDAVMIPLRDGVTMAVKRG